MGKKFKRLKLAQNKNFLGNKELRRKHISIGKELSYLLNVDIGDKILLIMQVLKQLLDCCQNKKHTL